MLAIYTFGYEGHTLETFLSLVDQHMIHLVIDVRETPRSTANPEFDKFPLIKALREHSSQYIYLKPLSCTREMQRLRDEELGTLKYFQTYERHLQQHRDLLREIARETSGLNLCILCEERDPETCHRTLVADYLHSESLEVPRLKHWV